MNSFLGVRLPWLTGRDRPENLEAGWRSVPFIDLLNERRSGAFTPVVIVLAVVLVLELFAVVFLNEGVGKNHKLTEAAQGEADQLRAAVSDAEFTIADAEIQIAVMDREMVALDAQAARAKEAAAAFEAGRADWGRAVDAVLAGAGPDLRIENVTGGPGGVIDITGTATNVAAMGRFQSHVRSVSDTLDLQSLHWEASGGALNFTAQVKVK